VRAVYVGAIACLLALVACYGVGESPVPPGVSGACSFGVVEALELNDVPRVKDLARRGATMTCHATAQRLEDAARGGRLEEVRFLLEVGVDPNRGTGHFVGRPDLLALVLIDHRGTSALPLARLLLSHGANPNQTFTYQRDLREHHTDDLGVPYERYDLQIGNATLLMVAAVEGDLAVARLLIEFGADAKAQDTDGRTALDHARGHNDIVALLARK
jgi:hypothetical protein